MISVAPFDWLLNTIYFLALDASVSRAFNFPTFLPFVLVALMSDSESTIDGTKAKVSPEHPKPQSLELWTRVFLI